MNDTSLPARRRREFVLALVLDVVGAGGALLVALRTWQVVTTSRSAPLRDDVLGLNGRSIDAAPTAFALVALAGVVAVLATRGPARRVVGAVLALAGAGLAWRGLASAGAITAARAESIVSQRHRTVTPDGAVRVAVHAVWPSLTVVCGVLVLAAGLLVAARGHRWQSMSARYESRPDPATDPARANASLWTALDRGEDPTG